ncbi:MAG: tRNA preQ1(34) S-adenosylmethionine ribosyltransferase-isomerase QueA [Candidatus Cloacimonadaceae bacterium]
MPDFTKKSSYYYNLPKNLIAQYPLPERTQARLMLLNRQLQTISHRHFFELPEILQAGDVLVLNKTRVIPARLFAKKQNGTKVEVFLLNEVKNDVWKCIVHPGKRLKQPQEVIFSEKLSGFIGSADQDGVREITFRYTGDFWQLLEQIGHVPLPPYIQRNDETSDKSDYQTVYASVNGSVASPTAGLHFTQELLDTLSQKGVTLAEVLLHVGLGTFRPVKVDDITHHKMHSEFCQIDEETADLINQAKKEGKRIIAVGTTCVRTLESMAENGKIIPGQKWTDIFIYPGKTFQIIDGLLTNFHLPESTLIMLVAAFAGYDFTMKAYETAVSEKYRFFSYGDAMLIL